MIRRSQLVGFLAVGKKVEPVAYRPDEIDNIARVTRQIGLDLYALRLEELEQRGRELQQQNEGLLQGLHPMLRTAKPAGEQGLRTDAPERSQ